MMKTRTVIYADDNKVLTNGKTYGTQIFLADGESAEDYYEISVEEYEEILRAQDDDIQQNAG
jgi:hypothetical protein